MKLTHRYLVAALISTGLFGCSSPGERVAKEQIKMEQLRQDAEQARRDQLTKKMEEELDDVVPSWFLSPPKMDESGVYGVGTATSKDLGFSIRKAKQLALYESAKVLKQEITGQERSLQRDNGVDGDIANRTEMLVDSFVNRVNVSGFDVVKTEVKAYDGQFHSFALIKVPFDEYNRILKQSKDPLANEFKQLFSDLEKRAEKRHAEEIAESQTKQTENHTETNN